MVKHTRVLALAGKESPVEAKKTSSINIIPDGNARLTDIEDPYDKAGKNVFTFLDYINDALFYILSSKNLEKRSPVFFKELKQSFSALRLAILQGKIWGDGIAIQADIDEDLFRKGENTEEKRALMAEVKAVCELNGTMAANQGVTLNKTVILRFGASKDNLGNNSRVLRTGSDGSHRFSDMLASHKPFISVASNTEFGKLDANEIRELVNITQEAQIDVEVTGHDDEGAIKLVESIDLDLFKGKKVHLTIACESVGDELIDKLRKKVRNKAITIIGEEEDPGNEEFTVQVVEYNSTLIPSHDGVMLGGQDGKNHLVIPPCTPGETRFYAASDPEHCGHDLFGVVNNIQNSTELEGRDRDPRRKFDERYCEVISTTNLLMGKIYYKLHSMGFGFYGKSEEIDPNEIPNLFLKENKISLPAISSYLTHVSFVGQVESLTANDIEAMANYVVCTYLVDQIFDSTHLDQKQRHAIRDFFISNTVLPTEIPGYDTIQRVKIIVEDQMKAAVVDSDTIGKEFSAGLCTLITIMSEERDEKYDSLDAYLEKNSASFGAGLVMMRLEAGLDETDQLDPSTRVDLYSLIDQLARLLNDLQTYERESDKQNAVSVLIKNGKEKAQATALIRDRINELKREITEKIADLNNESKLVKAIKRFLYFGVEVKEYALGIDSAFDGEKVLKEIIKQYNEGKYISVD